MKIPSLRTARFPQNKSSFKQFGLVRIAKFALVFVAVYTPLVIASSTGDTGSTGALAYPSSLPPEPLARAAIAAAPMTELARLSWQGEQSQSRLLRAGGYEWAFRAALQRRVERTGRSFTEPELYLERSLRWGDKAALDDRLAEAGQVAAWSSYEDAWHESARALMRAWFDTAREDSTVRSQADQLALADQQLAAVQKRVAAGDAPKLEALLAQGELDRSAAALSSARQRAQFLRVAFDLRYPALALEYPQLENGAPPGEVLPVTPDAATQEQAILAGNHEIELAKAHTEVARLRLARTDRDRRADPTIWVRYARERGGQENIVGISIAIPFGGVARNTRSELAAVEASKAETREREVLARVEYEAKQAARAVAQSRQIADQLAAAARHAATAADLAAKAYAEGEMPLGSLLQARRQAGESQLAATLAQVTTHEAATKALLDAHQLWTPAPLDNTGHP